MNDAEQQVYDFLKQQASNVKYSLITVMEADIAGGTHLLPETIRSLVEGLQSGGHMTIKYQNGEGKLIYELT